jgi:vacuolar-type H+-ATPase subunit E/Vma4
MSGAVAAAILEEKIIRSFREEGATTRSTSISLAERDAIDDRTFARLVRVGVIVEAESGKWFLDEQAWSRLRSKHRIWVVGITLFLVGAAAIIIYLRNS